MVTLPVASIMTGVFLALRMNVISTFCGMLMVVKLKTPPGGSCTAWLAVGLNGPSAPVEPLLKLPWARASVATHTRVKVPGQP